MGVAIVKQNAVALKERGLYEKALLVALIGTRANWAATPFSEIRSLIRAADPARLRAAGDPLPGPGPFRLFRGVAGEGRYRRERGFSWTDSEKWACFFALRPPAVGRPAVLSGVFKSSEILAFSDERGEREFLVLISRGKRLEVQEIPPDPGRYADLYKELIGAPTRERLRKAKARRRAAR